MKVSILLAVYNPNLIWLEQQLESLNKQTYSDIEVLVCDDCSPDVNYKSIAELVNQKITSFQVTIYQNSVNIGSTRTFSDLAYKANGDYISFCDQDDIWDKEKINQSVKVIQSKNSVLAYCKASVIDENNNMIEVDWDKMRNHANFGGKNNLYRALLFRNWIAGCFMLVRTDTVKKALPFIDGFFYDQWVALVASLEGSFICINESLIQYRRHSNTQTSSLTGVNTKEDYKYKYIDKNYEFILEANKRLPDSKVNRDIEKSIKWCKSRAKWWENFNLTAMIGLLYGIRFDKKIVVFELVMARLTEKSFIRKVKKIRGEI